MGNDLQRYYEELRKRLSIRANHILYFAGFEEAADVLSRLTDKNKIMLLRNCGYKTMEEIHEMVCRLREYNDSLNGTNDNRTDTIQRQMSIQELPLSKVQFIQRHYEQLLNRLSVRTQNIAKAHGLLQWIQFEPYLNSTEKDFLQYRNCGKKSAQEFLTLASELQKIIRESISRASYRIDDTFPFMDSILFTDVEEGFLSYFHKKCNHWPMIFLSGKCIQSVFSEQELMVIDGKESESLSKTR